MRTSLFNSHVVAPKVMAGRPRTVARASFGINPEILKPLSNFFTSKPAEPPVGRNLSIAIDNTIESLNAFEWTLHNIYRDGDQIHIIHVVPDLRTMSTGGIMDGAGIDPEADLEIRTGVLQATENYIKAEFVEKAHRLGAKCSFDLVEEAQDPRSVGDLILTQVRRQRSVLLVMASHKKGPLQLALQGSVSRYCSEKADVPVLMYHAGH